MAAIFQEQRAALIFLVDASVYVFRAYHSTLPQMCDRDGNPVHAVFGFARFLGDLSRVSCDGHLHSSWAMDRLSASHGESLLH